MIPKGRCESKKEWNSWRGGMKLVSRKNPIGNKIVLLNYVYVCIYTYGNYKNKYPNSQKMYEKMPNLLVINLSFLK